MARDRQANWSRDHRNHILFWSCFGLLWDAICKSYGIFGGARDRDRDRDDDKKPVKTLDNRHVAKSVCKLTH